MNQPERQGFLSETETFLVCDLVAEAGENADAGHEPGIHGSEYLVHDGPRQGTYVWVLYAAPGLADVVRPLIRDFTTRLGNAREWGEHVVQDYLHER